MANEENLKPQNKRTKSEQREIASKGGVASGKSRRRKAQLKKAFELILSLEVSSQQAKAQLESMGLEPTNEMLLALSVFQQAAKGNQRAVENYIKMTASEKDELDKKEQRSRIKALELENKRKEALVQGQSKLDEPIIIVDAWSEADD